MVEVSGSEDNFEVFNQFQSPKVPSCDFGDLPLAKANHTNEAPSIPNAMVLQQKTRSSLLDLLESYAGGNMPNKTIQTKTFTPYPS